MEILYTFRVFKNVLSQILNWLGQHSSTKSFLGELRANLEVFLLTFWKLLDVILSMLHKVFKVIKLHFRQTCYFQQPGESIEIVEEKLSVFLYREEADCDEHLDRICLFI